MISQIDRKVKTLSVRSEFLLIYKTLYVGIR